MNKITETEKIVTVEQDGVAYQLISIGDPMTTGEDRIYRQIVAVRPRGSRLYFGTISGFDETGQPAIWIRKSRMIGMIYPVSDPTRAGQIATTAANYRAVCNLERAIARGAKILAAEALDLDAMTPEARKQNRTINTGDARDDYPRRYTQQELDDGDDALDDRELEPGDPGFEDGPY